MSCETVKMKRSARREPGPLMADGTPLGFTVCESRFVCGERSTSSNCRASKKKLKTRTQYNRLTIHGMRSAMKVRNRRGMKSGAIFADEQLWVQKKIENRAYELWRAGAGKWTV
jgi:hypothetical protein